MVHGDETSATPWYLMFPDRTAPARYNASGKAMLRAAMPGTDDHDAAEDRVSAGPQVVVLPAVQRVHVSRWAAHRPPVAVLRVPVHAQAARRARGARLPEQRAQEGAKAAGQTGVRGNVHDRGQRLGGRTDIRTDHHRADIGENNFYKLKHDYNIIITVIITVVTITILCCHE